jgi:hypothetical protein
VFERKGILFTLGCTTAGGKRIDGHSRGSVGAWNQPNLEVKNDRAEEKNSRDAKTEKISGNLTKTLWVRWLGVAIGGVCVFTIVSTVQVFCIQVFSHCMGFVAIFLKLLIFCDIFF